MFNILKLVEIIATVVILIGIGFLLKKTGIAKKEHSQILNNIIIYIALPALIFLSISKANISINLVKIPLVAISVMLITLLSAFIIGKSFKFEKKLFGSFLLVAAIGNTGYLGYPLAQKLAQNPGLTKAIFYDIFGTVIVILTVGLVIAEVYGVAERKINIFKEIITFPPLIALVIAFLLKPFTLPVFIDSILSALSAVAVPLIMISVGLSLEFKSIGRYAAPVVLTFILKMILMPAIAWLFSILFGLTKSFLTITVMEAAMPPALLTLVFGLKYELDNDFLASVIFFLTVASVITIPLILLLVQ